jgi:ferredoxin
MYPNWNDIELCISCGHCVAICPKDAISHFEIKKNHLYEINTGFLPDYEQVSELIKARRSIRVFKKKQVDKNYITYVNKKLKD